jgi:hypothetical protein
MVKPFWAIAFVVACGGTTLDAVQRQGPSLIWPNAVSSANSDPWIAQHHDDIVQMRPNVLVLDYFNAPATGQKTPPATLAATLIDAIATTSAYHGYANPNAPAFLQYQVLKIVDLTDNPVPAGWANPSSTKLPVDATGTFDPTQLFSAAYADTIGIADPQNPGTNLALCALFERGIINELWLSVGESGIRAPTLIMNLKQVYDGSNNAIAGDYDSCAGEGCLPTTITCSVSVRIAHLSPTHQPTCDLEIRTLDIEDFRGDIPYLQANASPFFNANFASAFGASFNSWYDICDANSDPCATYPTPTSVSGTFTNGTAWEISPFIQGCGDARFPPNARYRWDYTNTTPVESRCEHYGLHDAEGGTDTMDTYTDAKSAALDGVAGSDCGGGYQAYLRQNIPGLNNGGIGADGMAMRNWWPFLFY